MVNQGSTYPTHSTTYGYKPKQNIPESQKNEFWGMQNLDWMISMSPIWFKQRVDHFYDLYNGLRDESKWDAITKTYGAEFPISKIPHIPLIRPLINRIFSDQQERDFNFTAHSEDPEAMQIRISEVSEKILTDILTAIKSGEDIDAAIDKIEKYYREEFQAEMELGVHRLITSYMYRNQLHRAFSDNFLDKLITGREYYDIRINRIAEDPDYVVIKPGTLFYSDNNVKWIRDCDWSVRVEELTPTEILDKFGDRMKTEDVKKIEDWIDMYHKDAMYKMNSLSDMDRFLDSPSFADKGQVVNNSSINHKIAVYYGQWKSIRKISYIENENKYVKDAPFIKILSEENLHELPASRKKKVRHRYIQDRWDGIRIADNIYVDIGKAKYAVRSMAQPSKVYLSTNGLTHNGKIKPYSLMGDTEDLQEQYDILNFHKTNLVALSGSRGSMMDLAQIPDFQTGSFAGNLKMFLYYKKMGTAFIDTNRENYKGQFNQFPTFDETLGPGMQVILSMLAHLEEVASRLTGVSRQSLGDVKQYDGAKATNAALQGTAIVTEYLHNEHEEFVQMALTDMTNALRVAYKDGYSGFFRSRQGTQEVFALKPTFSIVDWNIFLTDRSNDKQDIIELRAIASGMAQAQMLEFVDLIPLFKKGSVTEIMRYIEKNAGKRRAAMAEQQAQMAQLTNQLENAKSQAEVSKIQAEIAKISSEMSENQRKLLLEERELNDKKAIEQQKIALDAQRVELEAKQLDYASQDKLTKSAEIKNN